MRAARLGGFVGSNGAERGIMCDPNHSLLAILAVGLHLDSINLEIYYLSECLHVDAPPPQHSPESTTTVAA
jgi:hypothetical protein